MAKLFNLSFIIFICEELQYPLREKTTFKTGHSVPTGVNNHLSKFTEQDIELIYDLLINDTSLSLEAIGKKMNVSYGTISNINRGIRYAKEGYTYPLRKNKKKTNKFVEEEVLEIYLLL